MNISERLRQLLREHKATQSALAKYLECSRTFVSLVMNGKKNMTMEMLQRACDFFGITLSEFFKEHWHDVDPAYLRGFIELVRPMSEEEIGALTTVALLLPTAQRGKK